MGGLDQVCLEEAVLLLLGALEALASPPLLLPPRPRLPPQSLRILPAGSAPGAHSAVLFKKAVLLSLRVSTRPLPGVVLGLGLGLGLGPAAVRRSQGHQALRSHTLASKAQGTRKA